MPYVAKQRLMTVVDIRRALNALYPNVDDDEFSIQVSGFVHEHPMTAIGVVLISSIVLGTTDIAQLATFTSYSKRFVHAIAANMENSQLWRDGRYDCSDWSCGNAFPRSQQEHDEFWDHIQIAAGDMLSADAKSTLSEDACEIFWSLKRVN